jgi:hypothetical protein
MLPLDGAPMPGEPTVSGLIVKMIEQSREENSREHHEIMEAAAEDRDRMRNANDEGHRRIMASVDALAERIDQQNGRVLRLEKQRDRMMWTAAGGAAVAMAIMLVLRWLVPLAIHEVSKLVPLAIHEVSKLVPLAIHEVSKL